MVVSRPLPSAPSSVTIIKDTTGRYFASFVVEVPEEIAPQTKQSCGIEQHNERGGWAIRLM